MQYVEFIADQILDLIADGWTLERIGMIDGMPPRAVFLRWRRESEALSAKYEKAIQDRVAYSYDKLTDVAADLLDEDKPVNIKMERVRTATEIMLKLMGTATGIVQGYSGKGGKDKIPHIRLEFVESTEKRPPEAE